MIWLLLLVAWFAFIVGFVIGAITATERRHTPKPPVVVDFTRKRL